MWQTQFSRVLRYLQKIEAPISDPTEYEDNLWSFFQNCWHLKDWIRNDDTIPQEDRSAVVAEAETIDSLRHCADLANKSKHLKLIKPPRVDAALWHIEKISVTDSETGETLSEAPIGHVVASSVGSSYTALDLARKAVEDWRNLLRKHGLLS